MKSYLELLKHVRDNGESHDDRTGVGTVSVFGYQWRHRMADGFPLLTTKKVPLRWVFEELRWFLSGSTDVKDLQAAGVDIWDEWATAEQCAKFGRKPGDLGPIYGGVWRCAPFGPWRSGSLPAGVTNPRDWNIGWVDQIKCLVQDIRRSPNSRRLIVTGWLPGHHERVTLPPCHTLWQVKCHGDKELSLHLYARSIDSFLGLPFNIASYGLLLLILGRVTNRTPRDLIISFGDLHIYKNHFDAVATQLERTPTHLPRVIIGEVQDIYSVKWSDVTVEGYNPHPAIKAPVAV